MRYVTMAFIFYDKRLLVVLHKKIGKWLHVGGHLESDEDFEESLFREIKEETGLTVKIVKTYANDLHEQFFIKEENFEAKPLIMPFFIHKTITPKTKEIIFDYICMADSDKIKLQKEELVEYKWISQKEINSLDSFPLWKKLAIKAFEAYEKFK